MNNVKFRPVGSPNGQVIVAKVTQSKRAIERHRGISLRIATRIADARGYVRAGVRHG